MRSLASVLRAVALAALALWIVNAAWPRGVSPEVVSDNSLARDLPRLTASAAGVAARLDNVPGARERDWLAAMRDAGVDVRWSGSIAPVALETYPAVDPGGGAFVLMSAPSPSAVADELGPIDTIEAGSPAMMRVGDSRGPITLASGHELARVETAPATAPRRVLVAGAASWEAKFIIAALEEAGWRVDARLRVRPDHVVTQGSVPRPDTATHSAVVLVDTTVTVGGLDAFVRSGGGLLVAGEAPTPLAAWRVSRRETAPLGTVPDDTLWRGQSRVVFANIDTVRAIVLEEREGDPVIIARRHYAGRVLAVGYDDTWRWRMAGGANSVAEHRAWWSRHVASVAFRPAPARDVVTGAAPLPTLHDALGPPIRSELSTGLISRSALGNILAAFVLAALLLEWFIRRLRGMR